MRKSRKQSHTQESLGIAETATALYIRVSTQRQADEGYGLDAQRSELQAYCTAMGWTVADAHIYVDAGVSGKSTDRPAFQAMLEAARTGVIGRVVATKLDRIARNLKDLLQTVDELKRDKCALVVKKEQFDTSTAQGVFVLQMLGAVGELERSMIADRVAGGRAENAKAGGFNGAPQAYGYSGKFAIIAEQATWVREIFKRFLGGTSINAIAKALNDNGAPTQKGGSWYPMTIQQILRNGLYAGISQWDGVEVSDAHPSIIEKEIYESAQLRLAALRPGKQLESEIERRLKYNR